MLQIIVEIGFFVLVVLAFAMAANIIIGKIY